MRKREEEVKQSLSTSLRERDKEREQHKKDEAIQLFNALLADLVSIQPLNSVCYYFTLLFAMAVVAKVIWKIAKEN